MFSSLRKPSSHLWEVNVCGITELVKTHSLDLSIFSTPIQTSPLFLSNFLPQSKNKNKKIKYLTYFNLQALTNHFNGAGSSNYNNRDDSNSSETNQDYETGLLLFAAYAKTLIDNLKSLDIPILPGLNEGEFADIESTFNFTFPPDLRSILREGLPVGPAFPNWRSSSHQQLHILLNLPVLSLLKNTSLNNLWSSSWGQKPQDKNHAMSLAKKLLDKAPVLVPIYRNCYVPSTPNMAGNPVFYIDTEDVRVLSFDLSGFFKEVKFMQLGSGVSKSLMRTSKSFDMPAWAAKEARRIEFWTDVAERGKRVVVRDDTHGWWNGGGIEMGLGLKCCLEEVFWKLRDGGWREEDVREMMMIDGRDDRKEQEKKCGFQMVGDYGEGVAMHMGLLSVVLLRAGWSREDVLYMLHLHDHENGIDGGDCVEGNSINYF